ncbi:hypothetical protein D3C83_180100 [compost metagenome]
MVETPPGNPLQAPAVAAIRASPLNRETPILYVLDATARVPDSLSAGGADDFIAKPFRVVELAARVLTRLPAERTRPTV